MSELKPYDVEMYGHKTVLLLSAEDAAARGLAIAEPEADAIAEPEADAVAEPEANKARTARSKS